MRTLCPHCRSRTHSIPRDIYATILGLLSLEKRVKNNMTTFPNDAKFIIIIKMVHEFCEEVAKNLVKVSDWQKNGR